MSAPEGMDFQCLHCRQGDIERVAAPTLVEHYREPDLGTRIEAVKGLLKEALRSPDRAKMNTRHTSATGLQLGDKFVTVMDVLNPLKCPPLSPRQIRIVHLYFGDDLTNSEVAQRLGYSCDTIVREKYAALHVIESIIWPYSVEDGHEQDKAGHR